MDLGCKCDVLECSGCKCLLFRTFASPVEKMLTSNVTGSAALSNPLSTWASSLMRSVTLLSTISMQRNDTSSRAPKRARTLALLCAFTFTLQGNNPSLLPLRSLARHDEMCLGLQVSASLRSRNNELLRFSEPAGFPTQQCNRWIDLRS